MAAQLPAPRQAGRPRLLACLVALAYLVPALAVLGDYGPTWDFVQGDYPYGERLLGYLETGDARFLELQSYEPEPPVRAPHLDLHQSRFPDCSIYPVGSLLSALACRLLWTDLGLVPSMAAHNLPAALLGAVLVYGVTLFAARRFGALAAVVAGGSLALTPAFFGHGEGNLKDVPECCFYVGAVLLGFSAFESGRARRWLAAGLLTGLALAQKANALFLPVHLVVFLALAWLLLPRASAPRFGLRSLGWATLGFALAYWGASPAFWSEPIGGPVRWIRQMIVSGNYSFNAGFALKARQVSWQGPLAVALTIPVVTLALGLVGLCARSLSRGQRVFLVLGAAFPVARTLLPGMRNYSGVRHFLEFLPPLCLLAGVGAAAIAERLRAGFEGRAWVGGQAWALRAPAAVVALGALLPSACAVVTTHPNQTAYYNLLGGGLAGAQARNDPDAVDCWGNCYWQGLHWLDEHAEPGATLIVPYGDFIVRASQPVALRSDIRVWSERDPPVDPFPLYVMYLGWRPGSPAAAVLDLRSRPVHEVRVQGGVLLRIHRLDATNDRDWYAQYWLAEREARGQRRLVLAYMNRNPAVASEATRLFQLDREHALEPMRALFPAELQAALEAALRLSTGEPLDDELRR